MGCLLVEWLKGLKVEKLFQLLNFLLFNYIDFYLSGKPDLLYICHPELDSGSITDPVSSTG